MELTSVSAKELGIPAAFHRYVDEKSPAAVKMMAAQGLLPAPPKVMLPILVALSQDADAKVQSAAKKALAALPVSLLKTALGDSAHPLVLESLAQVSASNDAVLQLVLLHPSVGFSTLDTLARVVKPAHLNLIANNQKRLLEHPDLFEAIKVNPTASRALLDRVESFLLVSGVLKPDEDIVFPPEFIEEETPEKEEAPTSRRDRVKKLKEEVEKTEKEGGNLWSMINDMGIHEKIMLAMKGNATARSILIRSPNKMIAMATINSPRMTDKEAMAIAKNRNVIEDVFRVIANNRAWMRNYGVKLALLNNPKVPLNISIKLVPHCRNVDLKFLSKNKNVPSVVSKKAKEMLKKRTK